MAIGGEGTIVGREPAGDEDVGREWEEAGGGT